MNLLFVSDVTAYEYGNEQMLLKLNKNSTPAPNATNYPSVWPEESKKKSFIL